VTVTATETRVTVNLEAVCDYAGCADLAWPLHHQLSGGAYTWPVSVLPLPDTIGEWEAQHRTARKRANRCEQDGYTFQEINREEHEDAVHDINTSAGVRQGRPMSDSYQHRPAFTPLPDYPCDRHAIRSYGVTGPDGQLYAYIWVYRVGGLVMFSTILGHAAHLERHVMYLLVRGALTAQINAGPGFAFYNRHDSGTDGLRFFKERCGFQPARVRWEAA
jgi:hypothetical protein